MLDVAEETGTQVTVRGQSQTITRLASPAVAAINNLKRTILDTHATNETNRQAFLSAKGCHCFGILIVTGPLDYTIEFYGMESCIKSSLYARKNTGHITTSGEPCIAFRTERIETDVDPIES